MTGLADVAASASPGGVARAGHAVCEVPPGLTPRPGVMAAASGLAAAQIRFRGRAWCKPRAPATPLGTAPRSP